MILNAFLLMPFAMIISFIRILDLYLTGYAIYDKSMYVPRNIDKVQHIFIDIFSMTGPLRYEAIINATLERIKDYDPKIKVKEMEVLTKVRVFLLLV